MLKQNICNYRRNITKTNEIILSCENKDVILQRNYNYRFNLFSVL